MSDIRPTIGDSSWFVRDRFGMFIHWGLYSLPARHEWIKSKEEIPTEVYEKYFRHFDPDLYDPAVWADAAANAGMKYFVITTKHHEGFCLWDSQLTNYKATNTPVGRDLLHPMVDAFRARDLRVGLYHSLIDWHHPEYVIDTKNGPYRNHPDREKMNASRDQGKYIEYLHGQVRELLTQFGHIDIMWFDFSFPDQAAPNDPRVGKNHKAWGSEALLRMIRQLQPHILLDDRLDWPEGWDIKTPEQAQPTHWPLVNGQRVVWEACQTFSGSWGYARDEMNWRSVENLVFTLIDCVSKGGNLLLNVGPTGRGEFDRRALDRLAGMGTWMHHHSRSVYGCTQAPDEFQTPQDCRLTWNPDRKRMYVHILNWPYKHLHLKGQAWLDRVEYAQLLNDGSELKMGMDAWHAGQILGPDAPPSLILNLPQARPEVTIPVVELCLK